MFTKGETMRKSVLVLVALVCSAVAGQLPVIRWSSSIPVFDASGPAVVTQLSSGKEYAVAGSCGYVSVSSGNESIFIVKTDSIGVCGPIGYLTTFSKQGTGSHEVKALLPTADGGLVVAGTRRIATHVPTHDNAFVICTEKKGAVRWMKVFGTVEGGFEQHYRIEAAILQPNGNVVVGGQKGSTEWVCCLDGSGNELWSTDIDTGTVISLVGVASNGALAGCLSNDATGTQSHLAWVSRVGRVDNNTPKVECPTTAAYHPLVMPVNNLTSIVATTNIENGQGKISAYDFRINKLWSDPICGGANGLRGLTSFIPGSKPNEYYLGGSKLVDAVTDFSVIVLVKLDLRGDIVWQWVSDRAQYVYNIANCRDSDIVVLSQCNSSKSNLFLFKLGEQKPFTAVAAQSSAVPETQSVPKAKVFDVMGRKVATAAITQMPRGVYVAQSGFRAKRLQLYK